MTPSEIATYVREFLDLTASDIGNSLIYRWAAEGQRQVLKSRPRWAHLETAYQFSTLAEVTTYDISAAVRVLSAVDCPTVGALAVVDEAEATSRYFSSGEARTGQPEAVSRWGSGQLRIWPVPDDVYEIDVLGQRPAVTPGASDQLDVPDDLEDAVIAWTMHRAYAHQDDLDMAERTMREFERTVSIYADREDDDEDASPLVFGGGFGSSTRRRPDLDAHWVPGLGELGA
jgi:hypothetical protein